MLEGLQRKDFFLPPILASALEDIGRGFLVDLDRVSADDPRIGSEGCYIPSNLVSDAAHNPAKITCKAITKLIPHELDRVSRPVDDHRRSQTWFVPRVFHQLSARSHDIVLDPI